MSDQEPDKDKAALQARLAKLNDALRARDERAAAQTPTGAAAKGNSFGRAMSAGLNVFSEFVGGDRRRRVHRLASRRLARHEAVVDGRVPRSGDCGGILEHLSYCGAQGAVNEEDETPPDGKARDGAGRPTPLATKGRARAVRKRR